MKGLLTIIIVALLISLTSWLIPAWWWIMLVPLVFGIIIKTKVHTAALLSFFGGFLAWAGSSLFQYFRNSEVISEKVAELFGLPNGIILALIAGLIAGIISAIAGATGSSIHSIVAKPKKKYEYY